MIKIIAETEEANGIHVGNEKDTGDDDPFQSKSDPSSTNAFPLAEYRHRVQK